MNIHEYQAKEILRREGVPIPPGEVATTPDEGRSRSRAAFGGTVVVKAQVHAGGRGKAGGVKLAKTPDEATEIATKILGMQIKGLTVEKVLVTPAADIETEAYVGIIVDRASKKRGVHGEPRGRHRHRGSRGDDAREDPAAPGRPALRPAAVRGDASWASSFTTTSKKARAAAKIMQQLYTRVHGERRSLAEINPLVDDAGRRGRRARREDGDRRQRARSPSRASPRCATRAPKSRAKSRRARRTSRSSSSTETSAAS